MHTARLCLQRLSCSFKWPIAFNREPRSTKMGKHFDRRAWTDRDDSQHNCLP
jgi:hypothetical protein